MGFSTKELRDKKKVLEETLVEVKQRYEKVKGTGSIAEETFGEDLLSIREQISEINRYLSNSTNVLEEKPDAPRRKEVPTTPTVLVDGIPPRNGIPSSAKLIIKPNGDFYYVDANGNVLDR